MAPKFPRLRLSLLRSPLQANNPSLSSLPPQNPNPISPFGTLSRPKPTPPSPSPFPRRTAPNNNPFLFSSRTLASASGASGIVVVGSAAGFDTAFKKVQDEKLNAIFYFTAVWCGPCKMISPIIEELSKKFPHVLIYKVDIDQEGIASALGNLDVTSVPTFHFYQNGVKGRVVIGARVEDIKDTMEDLYE